MTDVHDNATGYTSAQLVEVLSQLSTEQIRFVIARQECETDKDAAIAVGIKPNTVYHWPPTIREAVRLVAMDHVATALHLRKRNLAKAMSVKVAGLDDKDAKVRQAAATEIIEWELGTATQKLEHTGEAGGPMQTVDLSKLSEVQLERVIAGDDIRRVLANTNQGAGGTRAPSPEPAPDV